MDHEGPVDVETFGLLIRKLVEIIAGAEECGLGR